MTDTMATVVRSNPDVWIYAHVPKCGGSTMKSILRKSFGAEFFEDQPLLYHRAMYSSSELRALLSAYPLARCFAGHRFNALVSAAAADRHLVALALVRDPVERFLSHYYFHRNRSDNFFPETKTCSLAEYFRWAIVAGHDAEMRNYQTWFLSGRDDPDGLEALERARQRGSLLMFPMERFDEIVIWMERAYPDIFSDCVFGIHNRRGNDAEGETEKAIRREFPGFANLDYRLWDIANQWLDDALAQSFADRAEVDQRVNALRARCLTHRRRNRLRRFMRSLLRLQRISS